MKIIVIPDCQIKVGSKTNHLECAGKHIVEEKPDVIVCLGDFSDMKSLSMFNSNKEREGLRIKDDIKAAKDAMEILLNPLKEYNKNNKKKYKPRMVFCEGNHSSAVRIARFEESHPETEGMMEPIDWSEFGWEVYPFLEPVEIEGIRFCHYFQNPHSLKGNPISGSIDIMLKNAGFSFCCGHQQTLKMGKHYLGDGTVRIGIVAGAFYQDYEKYMSPQGNHHFRGIIQLDNVKNGNADIRTIEMINLINKYGKGLK